MTRSTLQTRSIVTATFGILATLGIGSFASADPLPGEQLKFYLAPLNGAVAGSTGVYPVGAAPLATDQPAPFLGHDELSTATTSDGTTYNGKIMADDFLDTNPNPIAHITFWGSYMYGTDPGTVAAGVQQFRITLYSDIAGNPAQGIPSEPGAPIVSQTVNLVAGPLASSSATFTATPVPPNGPGAVQPGDSGLYEYNAELDWNPLVSPKAKTFPDAYFNSAATGDQVEWLSIVALVPENPGTGPALAWGWHDRDYGIADPLAAPGFETTTPPYHAGDDAVSGDFSFTSGSGLPVSGGYVPQDYIPTYDGISTSKDLAFALYTVPVPEPATLGFLGLIAPLLLMRRRRHSA